ncbi:AP-5 complex subunit zeta-1 [Scyliorhinus canicula]|uniref:AP-5 complex subunit zeta-1 n=1 Tax=Scyliorhinus canicula TaxID=7830 RepID=UPI0018F2F8B0|nr:AP-5 complex subunit zeta-1 [Scyliorhinus canicula]XP_038676078.1 AP-5 complex subunit zeta-1 [Scyliorhinus canicula]
MFGASAENLLRQAREVQDEDLQKFCSRISTILLNKEYNKEAVDSLQKLFLIVSVTKYSRTLPRDVLHKLHSTLCFLKAPQPILVLCSAILREVLPCSALTLSCDEVNDMKTMSLLSNIILTQGSKTNEVEAVCSRVLKLLESRQAEGQGSRLLLPILSKVLDIAPATLNEEQVNGVSKKFVDWLRYASTLQGVPLSSGGFFSPRSRQPASILEVDGAVAGDFFTVLSIGQYYTEDQWLNMHSFSMIRKWLQCFGESGGNSNDADEKSELDSSVMSMVSASSTSSRLMPPKERLREKTFEYCNRLIEQSDRKALKKSDSELQKACLVEAVTLLDLICRQDPLFVYRAFPVVKALYGRINSDSGFARVLLPVVQFYLNHSELAAVDSEAVYRHLFTKIPSELYHDTMVAFEFFQFCRRNRKTLSENVGIFHKSFPNLLKFLAWNTPSLFPEFIELLPDLICPDTSIEMLHSLLDLPCLTAALEAQFRSPTSLASEKVVTDQSRKTPTSAEASQDQYLRRIFLYILRVEAGAGDTIDRLNLLHEVLLDMAQQPRVVQCAQTVPILLQVFFNVVTQFADGPLINQLILVILERSSLLYDIPDFKAEVQRVFSSQLRVLCKKYPPLIVEQSKELLEFCGAVSNIINKENFFTHVVWAVGEYMSLSYDKRCTVEQITKFFETLEALLFEITQLRASACVPKYSPWVITVLMTTLAKLASRSQDLIPRVSLSLSKMRPFVRSALISSLYSEDDIQEILARANELNNLLKAPNVAQLILGPSADIANPRWYKDTNASLPLTLRTVSKVLQREPAPGFSA